MMKTIGQLLIFALAIAWVAGCGTVKQVGKATAKIVPGGSDPVPERVWNGERTWKRVHDRPPTYVPFGYRGPISERGEWLTDERDGKRLLVPPGGVDGMPESVLRAEAWKATRE